MEGGDGEGSVRERSGMEDLMKGGEKGAITHKQRAYRLPYHTAGAQTSPMDTIKSSYARHPVVLWVRSDT